MFELKIKNMEIPNSFSLRNLGNPHNGIYIKNLIKHFYYEISSQTKMFRSRPILYFFKFLKFLFFIQSILTIF